MTDEIVALSRRCEESTRLAAARGREVARFGPFEALIDLGSDLTWLNYAVPIGPLDDRAAALAALAELKAHFLSRGRRPRFEFNAAPWPALPALLEAGGLALQERQPLMLCTPAELRPFAAPGVAVQMLAADAPDADLLAVWRIQAEAFGGTGAEPEAQGLGRLRDQLRSGASRLALGLLDGAPAGAAAIAPAAAGVAELVGVATRAESRRRGVAATLSAALTAAHFAAGGQLAWLSAATAGAQAAYARVGYALIDERVIYIQ